MKKFLIIIIIIVAVAALALLGGILYINSSGNEFETGRVVECGNGVYVFVNKEGGFWQMNDTSLSGNLFKNLKTGDGVLIFRSSAMAMSYPGQCAVKLCFKRADGNIDDIPADVLEELRRIGWVE